MIERLKRSGTTVVLISHRMQEVRAFCSVLTIFRNGRTVGAHAMNDVADAEIIELMIGRSLGAAFPAKPVRADAEAVAPDSVLSCRNLATAGGGDISFSLCAGEVLGLAAWTAWGSAICSWRYSGSLGRSQAESGSADKRYNCARRLTP